MLKNGSTGPDVKSLQEGLTALGFEPGTADGIFGPKTLAAVKAFQESRQLDADGIVGPATAEALERAAMAAQRKADAATEAAKEAKEKYLDAIDKATEEPERRGGVQE